MLFLSDWKRSALRIMWITALSAIDMTRRALSRSSKCSPSHTKYNQLNEAHDQCFVFGPSGDFSPQSDHALPVQAAKHPEPIHPADRRQSFLRWFSFFSKLICGVADCDLHKQHFLGGKNDRIKRQVVNQHHIIIL